MKKITAILFALIILLCSCDIVRINEIGDTDADIDQKSDDVSSVLTEERKSEDMFTKRDSRTEYDDAVQIRLDGDSVIVDSDSVTVTSTGLTISDEGTYVLSGVLNNGTVTVNVKDNQKVQLVLNGVDINSETSAAIYILEADKVFVTLAAGTENVVSNGGEFIAIDKNNIDAAIFSKQDLTFNGSGSLTVNSSGGHGIVSKDDLVFTGGNYSITAASHGLSANDSIRTTGSEFDIISGKDGLHADNDDDETKGFVFIENGVFNITCDGDGISASADVQIYGGEFTIVAGGGSENGREHSSDMSGGGHMGGGHGRERSDSSSQNTDTVSTKGIKAASDLIINDGVFSVNSADDAVHSNSSITVNGGTFDITTGDDGFHADGYLWVNDCDIHISESYEGLEALHVEINGGDIYVVSTDDGLNAAGGTDESGFGGAFGNDMFGGRGGGRPGDTSSSNGTIVISGGNIYINASGDGIDANGTLEITGGYTVVCGPTTGDTATLDFDISGVITGGTFIGTGASSMAQTFSSSEQGVISLNVGRQNAGTLITLEDEDGNVLFSHTPELSFQIVILSSPELVSGQSYKVTVGSSSGEFKAS